MVFAVSGDPVGFGLVQDGAAGRQYYRPFDAVARSAGSGSNCCVRSSLVSIRSGPKLSRQSQHYAGGERGSGSGPDGRP